MEVVSEDYVQTLLSMGFPNEGEIRRALKIGKNDLNEALSILTNDHPTSSFDTLDDIEMKDVNPSNDHGSTAVNDLPVYGPPPPPTYEEAVSARIHEDSVVSFRSQYKKAMVMSADGP